MNANSRIPKIHRTVERKNYLLKICDERGDRVVENVCFRILGLPDFTDLRAAQAQYHFDCYTTFVAKRNVSAASAAWTSGKPVPNPADLAFKYVVDDMKDHPEQIWNS